MNRVVSIGSLGQKQESALMTYLRSMREKFVEVDKLKADEHALRSQKERIREEHEETQKELEKEKNKLTTLKNIREWMKSNKFVKILDNNFAQKLTLDRGALWGAIIGLGASSLGFPGVLIGGSIGAVIAYGVSKNLPDWKKGLEEKLNKAIEEQEENIEHAKGVEERKRESALGMDKDWHAIEGKEGELFKAQDEYAEVSAKLDQKREELSKALKGAIPSAWAATKSQLSALGAQLVGKAKSAYSKVETAVAEKLESVAEERTQRKAEKEAERAVALEEAERKKSNKAREKEVREVYRDEAKRERQEKFDKFVGGVFEKFESIADKSKQREANRAAEREVAREDAERRKRNKEREREIRATFRKDSAEKFVGGIFEKFENMAEKAAQRKAEKEAERAVALEEAERKKSNKAREKEIRETFKAEEKREKQENAAWNAMLRSEKLYKFLIKNDFMKKATFAVGRDFIAKHLLNEQDKKLYDKFYEDMRKDNLAAAQRLADEYKAAKGIEFTAEEIMKKSDKAKDGLRKEIENSKLRTAEESLTI